MIDPECRDYQKEQGVFEIEIFSQLLEIFFHHPTS
jgi:hypothetical protein